MAFNISQFKSEMDKFGGPGRGHLFEITISPIGGGTTSATDDKKMNPAQFSFFCKTASIPAMSLETMNYSAVGQLKKQFAVGVSSEPVSTIFMCDSDHQIVNFFHQWFQKIVNHGSGGGSFDQVNERLPYEIGYKDDYTTDISIRHYSTESDINKYYEVILYNAYPNAIGDLGLSWEENDSFLTLPVSFSYDNIKFSGSKTGTPDERSSRGTGLLDSLGALAGFGSVVKQTIDQGVRFDTIQDAVNRITRVRNSFDNLSDKI